MRLKILAVLLCVPMVSCTSPVGQIKDIQGCYFGSKSEVLKIEGNNILDANGTIISKILRIHNENKYSTVELDPGIKIIDNRNKILQLYKGDENYLMMTASAKSPSINLASSPDIALLRKNCS